MPHLGKQAPYAFPRDLGSSGTARNWGPFKNYYLPTPTCIQSGLRLFTSGYYASSDLQWNYATGDFLLDFPVMAPLDVGTHFEYVGKFNSNANLRECEVRYYNALGLWLTCTHTPQSFWINNQAKRSFLWQCVGLPTIPGFGLTEFTTISVKWGQHTATWQSTWP